MIKIDWNKEFVKYIKRLQKTPKYRGFTYPCLVSVKKIKKEFQDRKKLYLEMVERKMAAAKAATPPAGVVTEAAAAAISRGGGRRPRRRRTRKKIGGRSTESEGLPAAPDPLPWKDQLVDTKLI